MIERDDDGNRVFGLITEDPEPELGAIDWPRRETWFEYGQALAREPYATAEEAAPFDSFSRHAFACPWFRVAHHNERDKLGGTLTVPEWLALRLAFVGCCAYCGVRKDNKLVLEHVRPLSLGGRTSPDNVLPACFSCNASKGSRPLHEWRSIESEWWIGFIGRVADAAERYPDILEQERLDHDRAGSIGRSGTGRAAQVRDLPG